MKKATIKVGNQRLLRLAKLLRSLPRKRFDYTHWVGHDWKGAKDLSCGTTACALGWATTIPSLRRLGLRLKPDPYWGTSVVLGKGRSCTDLEAGERVFGLDASESDYLFIPVSFDEEDATPKQVAKKIERFVKERQND